MVYPLQPFYPKTDEQRRKLLESLKNVFIFRTLDEVQFVISFQPSFARLSFSMSTDCAGAIQGRLNHFLPHWLRTGWQRLAAREKFPLAPQTLFDHLILFLAMHPPRSRRISGHMTPMETYDWLIFRIRSVECVMPCRSDPLQQGRLLLRKGMMMLTTSL